MEGGIWSAEIPLVANSYVTYETKKETGFTNVVEKEETWQMTKAFIGGAQKLTPQKNEIWFATDKIMLSAP